MVVRTKCSTPWASSTAILAVVSAIWMVMLLMSSQACLQKWAKSPQASPNTESAAEEPAIASNSVAVRTRLCSRLPSIFMVKAVGGRAASVAPPLAMLTATPLTCCRLVASWSASDEEVFAGSTPPVTRSWPL